MCFLRGTLCFIFNASNEQFNRSNKSISLDNSYNFFIYLIKDGLNGESCSLDSDCLTTSYFHCDSTSNTCSCYTGFTWDSITSTCTCVSPLVVSGSGSSTICGININFHSL